MSKYYNELPHQNVYGTLVGQYYGIENHAVVLVKNPEEIRDKLIEKTRRVAQTRRQEAFLAALPVGHFDDTKLLHTDPKHRAILAKAALYVRKVSWREAELISTFKLFNKEGMEPSVDGAYRRFYWMSGMYLDDVHGIQSPFWWDTTNEHGLGENLAPWISIGTPTEEDRLAWQPEPTIWDVEDAAFHELELHMGGMASMYLHGLLDDPEETRKDAGQRVALYLADNRRKIPKDPWDPNNWGHDARLKSLVMKNAQSEVIPLSPEFDPDVLEYTVSGDTANSTTKPTPVDTRATVVPAHTASASTYTVTAKDGVTKRVYKVTRSSE